ncbi:ATP-dependent zinc protease [Candidatus Woesearchaeota archaeon]|nr:ATP-dependent zinc protease [Candidatus Woesearchaeota archaeon]
MKTIIGLTERVVVHGALSRKWAIARIDTGATKSSIDQHLAAELALGPAVRQAMVKSAHGTRLRPVVKASINVAGRRLRVEFTIADREHMKYKVLIGQNIIKRRFLIDPSKVA